ncbi:hypothetical protein [Treponema denticola]|uniref:hypothetical protein n=1 Tax=Treponema denticola TaxID=158 RepID=UPI002107A7AF|nr:hypothetical protein [Treponema denticola]UTY22792.1 hypothetical protein E4N78_00360 [Treponema denticola]
MKINKILFLFLLFITLSFQNFAEDADGGKDKNQESKQASTRKESFYFLSCYNFVGLQQKISIEEIIAEMD